MLCLRFVYVSFTSRLRVVYVFLIIGPRYYCETNIPHRGKRGVTGYRWKVTGDRSVGEIYRLKLRLKNKINIKILIKILRVLEFFYTFVG